MKRSDRSTFGLWAQSTKATSRASGIAAAIRSPRASGVNVLVRSNTTRLQAAIRFSRSSRCASPSTKLRKNSVHGVIPIHRRIGPDAVHENERCFATGRARRKLQDSRARRHARARRKRSMDRASSRKHRRRQHRASRATESASLLWRPAAPEAIVILGDRAVDIDARGTCR